MALFEIAEVRLQLLSADPELREDVREAAGRLLVALREDSTPGLQDMAVLLFALLLSDTVERQRPPPASEVFANADANANSSSNSNPGGAKTPRDVRERSAGSSPLTKDPTGLGLGGGHYETREDGRRVFVEDR